MGYHSMVSHSLVVTLQGSPFRIPANLSGNRSLIHLLCIPSTFTHILQHISTLLQSVALHHHSVALIVLLKNFELIFLVLDLSYLAL